MELKAQLQRSEAATRVVREAAEAAVKASYERGVLDTKEVAVVCKDYYTESWGVAMDRTGVPADFELRKVENIFFPEDIREIPNLDTPAETFLPTQATLLDPNALGGEEADKEAQQSAKDKPSKDFLTIRDVVLQAKEAESKSRTKGACSEVADPEKDVVKDKV